MSFCVLRYVLMNEIRGVTIFLFLLLIYVFKINFRLFHIKLFSFFLIFLTLWLMYFLFKVNKKYRLIFGRFVLIFFLCFRVKNFLLFFIGFELSLIPTYLLVVRGSTPERIFAGKYLILYTFLGALPLLFRVIYTGSWKMFFFGKFLPGLSLLKLLVVTGAFLIKLPIFFFHLWLPKAHVEASTEGSMVLAGILLKLGSYGLILCAPWLEKNLWLTVFIIFGGIYSGIFSLVQIDLKSLIAYSSILHMRFMVFSCFRGSDIGIWGVVLMSVGHGFISANLFFLLSFVYKETGRRKVLVLKRRLINYGLLNFLVAAAVILNRSAPFSIKFFGEFFLFLGVVPYLKI